MDFEPAEQRVLVLPIDKGDSQTSTGLFLPPDNDQDKAYRGTVIRCGKGSAENPMLYNNGDVVLFSDYAGLEISLDLDGNGTKFYKVMNQMDIIGKIKDRRD